MFKLSNLAIDDARANGIKTAHDKFKYDRDGRSEEMVLNTGKIAFNFIFSILFWIPPFIPIAGTLIELLKNYHQFQNRHSKTALWLSVGFTLLAVVFIVVNVIFPFASPLLLGIVLGVTWLTCGPFDRLTN